MIKIESYETFYVFGEKIEKLRISDLYASVVSGTISK